MISGDDLPSHFQPSIFLNILFLASVAYSQPTTTFISLYQMMKPYRLSSKFLHHPASVSCRIDTDDGGEKLGCWQTTAESA